MEFSEAFNAILSKYGLVAALVVAMAVFGSFLFYMTLRWIMNHIERLQAESRDREKTLVGIIDGHAKALDQHTEMSREFQVEMKTANQFQRQEHDRMIQQLDRISMRLSA